MSTSARLTFACLGLALAGCPREDSGLPTQLWLATFQSEANVQLVEKEPPPF